MIDNIFLYFNKETKRVATIRTSLNYQVVSAFSGFPSELLNAVPADASCIVITHEDNRAKVSKEAGTEEGIFSVPWLPINTLAWPLAFAGIVGAPSLDVLAKHFDVKNEDPFKGPESCVTALMDVYREMMARYKVSLVASTAVESMVGPHVRTVRNIMGRF